MTYVSTLRGALAACVLLCTAGAATAASVVRHQHPINAAGDSELNPQPLPPVHDGKAKPLIKTNHSLNVLNPQPLPPAPKPAVNPAAH